MTEPQMKRMKKDPMRSLNAAVGGLGCLGMIFGGIFWLALSIGITVILSAPALIVCLFVIPACYRAWKEQGKPKRRLHIARITGIGMLLLMLTAPLLLLKGEHVPLLYPVKRLAFTVGVHNPDNSEILPYLLPHPHEDYYFRTEPSPAFPAQDHQEDAWLFLHTDAAYLHGFEEKLNADPRFEKTENHPFTEAEQEAAAEAGDPELPLYQNVPYWIWRSLQAAGFTDDLSQAVVWQGGRCGAVICRDTGLLAIWI